MILNYKIEEGGIPPLFATDGAACFDLYARKIEFISPNKAIIYLGVAFDIPKGKKIVIQPRSSFTHTGWVMSNSPAQIDEDYKKEVQMRIIAIPNGIERGGFEPFVSVKLKYPEIPFKEGERVCQGYLEHKIDTELIEVFDIKENGRGGFGHTGKS